MEAGRDAWNLTRCGHGLLAVNWPLGRVYLPPCGSSMALQFFPGPHFMYSLNLLNAPWRLVPCLARLLNSQSRIVLMRPIPYSYLVTIILLPCSFPACGPSSPPAPPTATPPAPPPLPTPP